VEISVGFHHLIRLPIILTSIFNLQLCLSVSTYIVTLCPVFISPPSFPQLCRVEIGRMVWLWSRWQKFCDMVSHLLWQLTYH